MKNAAFFVGRTSSSAPDLRVRLAHFAENGSRAGARLRTGRSAPHTESISKSIYERGGTGQSGFTLLEVLIATLIMGIAVAGVLSGLAGAARNAARLTDYDRATLFAQQKMDQLLADPAVPRNQDLTGELDPKITGGTKTGWRARVAPFEAPPGAGPGVVDIDRVELEIWWLQSGVRHTFSLEGFRRSRLRAGDPTFR